jgi:hypothetical protein
LVMCQRRNKTTAIPPVMWSRSGLLTPVLGPCNILGKAVPPPPSEAAVLAAPSARMKYSLYSSF